MIEPLRVALVGVKKDGVSKVHWENMLELQQKGFVQFVAAAEMNLDDNPAVDYLRRMGVKVYQSHQDMIRGEEKRLDAVTIATPHFTHIPIAKDILFDGAHVFLEKPPAVTVESGDLLLRYARDCQKIVGVNYMFTAAASALELRKRLRAGDIGEVLSATGIGKWTRSDEYFKGRAWAGKKMFNGEATLDGCLFNQFPHLLNQLVYFLAGAGVPVAESVRAELYRGHYKTVCEMEDTASLHAKVSGKDIFLYCTTCMPQEYPFRVLIKGTEGEARWNEDGYAISRQNIPDASSSIPETWKDRCMANYMNFLQAITHEVPLYWDLERALLTTKIINGAYMSSDGILQVPDHNIELCRQRAMANTSGQANSGEYETLRSISNIENAIADASASHCMFSELVRYPAFKRERPAETVDMREFVFDLGRVD